jgi:hypothetical protein
VALSIDIAANTRAAQRSVGDLGEALEDVSDSLDDLARAADRDGDKTERALDGVGDAGRDAARDIDRATESVERSFRDQVTAARKTEDAIKDVGTKGAADLRNVGGVGSEVADELRGNLGETFSSFKGDLADLPQIAQDTLGGLAGSGALGGIPGLAITAAGAAGLGLITAELTKQQEEADRLRERLASAYQTAAEEGRDYLSVSQIIADANDLMFNPERADEYKRAREDAKALALDESTVIAALAGELGAQEEVLGRINALQAENSRLGEAGKITSGEYKTQEVGLQTIENRWRDLNTVTDENAQRTRTAQDVTSRFLQKAIEDAGTATQEVDEFGNKLLTLPDGEQVVIDAKTGKAHQDLDRFKGDVDDIPEEIETRVRVRIDTSEWDRWTPAQKTGYVEGRLGRTWE